MFLCADNTKMLSGKLTERRMKGRFVGISTPPAHEKLTKERKPTVNREPPGYGPVIDEKHNRCTVFPGSLSMLAESIERRGKTWIVRTKTASDLVIQVGDSTLHLHKLPMVSKSKYLNRLIFQRNIQDSKDHKQTINIDDFPGGTTIFELVVKFCYGWKVNLTATNVAPLYSASYFLEMGDDLAQGNLISQTESFLSFVILSSWKDTFKILKSCESISPWAKKLHLLTKCSESIAFKACLNPQTLSHGDANWWVEDVSVLRIDHFIQVIESIKRKGVGPELIGSCISLWTTKWISQISDGVENLTLKHLTQKLHMVTVESLIRILPMGQDSVSCTFLLHLFKVGLLMKIDEVLLNKVEVRIGFMLEKCSARDLLVMNYEDVNDGVYDVGIVVKVVKSCVLSNLAKTHESKLLALGKLVDGYLSLISRDKKLKVNIFQSVLEVLPENARFCLNNLYRAIDMYLKAHPSLTEEERTGLCKCLEYHKLSQEAREHAMKNERLPLKIATRFILLEQVNMSKSMTAIGSGYYRTKTQAIIKGGRDVGAETGWLLNSQMEIKMMKKEMETLKLQLNNLNMNKLNLQRQIKRCIF